LRKGTGRQQQDLLFVRSRSRKKQGHLPQVPGLDDAAGEKVLSVRGETDVEAIPSKKAGHI